MIEPQEIEEENKSNKENQSNNINPQNSEKKENSQSNISQVDNLRRDFSPEELVEFVFKVNKLGKRGFSNKERILRITKSGIEYYVMLNNNRFTKEFLDEMKNIYTSKKFEDLSRFKTLGEMFNRIPENEKKLKNKFENYSLKITEDNPSVPKESSFTVYNLKNQEAPNPDNTWIMDAGEEMIRNLIFQASKKLLQGINEYRGRKGTSISRLSQMINKQENNMTNKKDDLQKDKLSSDKMIILTDYKDKIKYVGIMYQGFMKEYLKAISDFHKKKREQMEKLGYKIQNENDIHFSEYFPLANEIKGQNKITRMRKYTEMYQKNEMSREFSEEIKDKDNIDPLKEQINDTLRIAYLELAIYHFYDMFIKYCEKVVEKIVNHLYTFDKADDILKPGKLHPIVFPNPSNFTQILNDNDDKIDETSEPVLLYNVWGVNYTLTWNRLTYKFGETVGTSGNWKRVKHQFQQKNYFQDLLIKLASCY